MPRAAFDADLQAAEQQAANLARRYQETAKSRPDNPNLREMREDVREAVAKAFEARQKVMSAELAGFEARMARIKQSLEMRGRIEDQIIDRRVQELIAANPSGFNRDAQVAPTASPIELAGPPQLDDSVETALPRESLPRQGALPLSSLREITTLRSDIVDNAEEVRSIEAVLEANPQSDMLGNLQKQLEGARRRLNALKEELDTLIRLQEAELRHAEAEYSAREKDLKRVETLRKQGAITGEEVDRMELSREAAQLRLVKAKTLLDFLLKARPPEKAEEKPSP
jgi:hypothetical protein